MNVAGQIIRRSERIWVVRLFTARGYSNKVVHGTRENAQAYLNKVLREQQPGSAVAPARQRLGSFLERWLEQDVRPKLREKTYKSYEDMFRLYVRKQLGGMSLKKLTPLMLQSYYAKLREQQIGVATLRRLHVMITSSLDQALRWGLIASNPAKGVNGASLRTGAREHERPEELHHGLALNLALSTGLRPGEYLALLWKDIDLDNGRLIVERSLHRIRKGGWRFEPTQSRGCQRTITLPPGLVEMLREHRASQPAVAPELPDFVFRTCSGQPIRPLHLKRDALRGALQRALLDPRLHLCSLPA